MRRLARASGASPNRPCLNTRIRTRSTPTHTTRTRSLAGRISVVPVASDERPDGLSPVSVASARRPSGEHPGDWP